MIALVALALAACQSTRVALLDGEDGESSGAVVELDPRTEAEKRLVNKTDARAVKRYAALRSGLPPRATRITLYFAEGTTKLTPESEPELDRLLQEVSRRPGAEVLITGHTDTVGRDEDNDVLSMRRAEEVRNALGEHWLDLAITRAVGRGERDLLVKTADNVREDRNRRVEVIIR
jgi:outer membrane protein OmpA-like peptidoglycan-associated protein